MLQQTGGGSPSDSRQRSALRRSAPGRRGQLGRRRRCAREDLSDAEANRDLAERLHALIKDDTPKTWYKMPAANLDQEAMWATAVALTQLTLTAEKITALVKKAVRR